MSWSMGLMWGVSKFEQRGSWAPTPCIFSFYTQFHPLLFAWSQSRYFQKFFFIFLEKDYKMGGTSEDILSLIKAMILKLLESQISESDESYGPAIPQKYTPG